MGNIKAIKKIHPSESLGFIARCTIKHPETNLPIVKYGDKITYELLQAMHDSGMDEILVTRE